MSGETSRHMHRPQRVHESGMFGRWIHPTRALQLIDISKTLDPGGIDQVFLGVFMGIRMRIGYGKGDVLVNGIGDEGRSIIRSVRSIC